MLKIFITILTVLFIITIYDLSAEPSDSIKIKYSKLYSHTLPDFVTYFSLSKNPAKFSQILRF